MEQCPGGDIREGNYTLPVIFALQSQQGPMLRKLMRQEILQLPEILKIIEKNRGIDHTKKEADIYIRTAQEAARQLQNRELADALKIFIDSF